MKIGKVISLLFVLFLVSTTKLKAQTVYITDNGKKYHAKNCGLAKTGKKGIELAEAKKQGYEACKNCKAETSTALKVKTKADAKQESKK